MAKALEFLELDFHDPKEVFLAVTYSSVDFREIAKRKGSHSKSLVMPSTKKNDSFFGLSFEVSSEGHFDPLIKVPIQISDIEFYGTLELRSIEVLNNKPQSYTVNIFSDLADWASLIGEKSVRTLKHHTSHILNKTEIERSWHNNGTSRSGYVYPLISYGNFLQLDSNRDSSFNIDPAYWRPAFFALPLIRQIFLEVGYNFIDKGIASTPFRDLILPFTSKDTKIDESRLDVSANISIDDLVSSTQFNPENVSITDTFNTVPLENQIGTVLGNVTTPNSVSVMTIIKTVKMARKTKDDSGLFLLPSSKFTSPADDLYKFNINLSTIKISIERANYRGNKHNGGIAHLFIYDKKYNTIANGAGVALISTPHESVSLNLNAEISLKKNQEVFIGIKFLVFNSQRIHYFTVIDGSIDIRPGVATLVSGDLLDHSKIIQNIKKIDLIREVVRMGNFRIITDNQAKTVEIVQEKNFLLNTPEEWTDKRDESKPSNISLIQNQGAKELTWSYSNDSNDGFISDKSERNDVEWATKRVHLDSEHRKGTREVHSSIFSSTIDGIGMGLPVPIMSNQELIQDEAVSRGPFETSFSNRVLIYGGIRDGNIVLDNVYKTIYPYSYFVSNEFSLQWDNLSDFYEGALDLGLVDRYYQNAINILNKSRLYTGWFFLTEVDIGTLDFRKPKIINGIHYYINKVIDYKVGANQPTKVELISR